MPAIVASLSHTHTSPQQPPSLHLWRYEDQRRGEGGAAAQRLEIGGAKYLLRLGPTVSYDCSFESGSHPTCASRGRTGGASSHRSAAPPVSRHVGRERARLRLRLRDAGCSLRGPLARIYRVRLWQRQRRHQRQEPGGGHGDDEEETALPACGRRHQARAPRSGSSFLSWNTHHSFCLSLGCASYSEFGIGCFDLQISRSDPVETEQAVLRLPPFP
jgi:hypothetical protein